MISFYKWKKQAVFMLLGIIPLIVFLFVFFPSMKYYTIEGIRFTYIDASTVIISLIAAVITIVVIIFIGNKMLRHAFTQMLEGKGLLALILDSTGLIGSFNVKVNGSNMKGEFLQKGNDLLEDTYDTDMMHRLIVPQDIGITKAFKFDKDENDNIVLGESLDVLILPKGDEKYNHLFSFENRPVFIYNKVMNKFLSRDALAKYEKDIEIKHNALNILKKIQETDKNFRDFGRYMGDNIKPKAKGLFASPLMKYIIWGAIIGLILLIIIMFVPGFLNAGNNIGFP